MIRARLQHLEVPHRKILNKTNYNPAALFLAQIILVIWAIRYGLTKSNILLNMIFEEIDPNGFFCQLKEDMRY